MPRIRDLGISHIPATMRPPEIGPGGAFDMPAGPDAAFPMYLETCNPSPCNQCPNSCVGNSGCPTNTCCCVNTGADTEEGQPCPNDTQQGGEGNYQLGGLTHEAILQLKRHLQDRIGTQFQM